jgi:hypothetical protein
LASFLNSLNLFVVSGVCFILFIKFGAFFKLCQNFILAVFENSKTELVLKRGLRKGIASTFSAMAHFPKKTRGESHKLCFW